MGARFDRGWNPTGPEAAILKRLDAPSFGIWGVGSRFCIAEALRRQDCEAAVTPVDAGEPVRVSLNGPALTLAPVRASHHCSSFWGDRSVGACSSAISGYRCWVSAGQDRVHQVRTEAVALSRASALTFLKTAAMCTALGCLQGVSMLGGPSQ